MTVFPPLSDPSGWSGLKDVLREGGVIALAAEYAYALAEAPEWDRSTVFRSEKIGVFFDQGPVSRKTDPLPCRLPFGRGPICPVAGHESLPPPCFPMAELPDSGAPGPPPGCSIGDGAQWRCRLPDSGRPFFAPFPEVPRNTPVRNKPESFREPSLAFSGCDSSGLSFSGWCCRRGDPSRGSRLACDRRHKVSGKGCPAGGTEALKKRIFLVIKRSFL